MAQKTGYNACGSYLPCDIKTSSAHVFEWKLKVKPCGKVGKEQLDKGRTIKRQRGGKGREMG